MAGSICQCQAQVRGALTHFPQCESVCLSLSLGSSPPWVVTAGDILDSSSSGREIGGGGSGEEEGDSAVRSATGRSSSWAGPPTASSSPSPRQPRVSGEEGCHHHGSSLALQVCSERHGSSLPLCQTLSPQPFFFLRHFAIV